MDIHNGRRLWIIARHVIRTAPERRRGDVAPMGIVGVFEYEQYDEAREFAENAGGVLVGLPVIHDFSRPTSRHNATTRPDARHTPTRSEVPAPSPTQAAR